MDLNGRIRDSGLLKKEIAKKIGKSPAHFSMMLSGKAKMTKVLKLQVESIIAQANKIRVKS